MDAAAGGAQPTSVDLPGAGGPPEMAHQSGGAREALDDEPPPLEPAPAEPIPVRHQYRALLNDYRRYYIPPLLRPEYGFYGAGAPAHRYAPPEGRPAVLAAPTSMAGAPEGVCAVCFEAARLATLVPCGHTRTCAACIAALPAPACPVCRAPIERVVRVIL